MTLPPDLHSVLDAIRQAGGRPRLVGGCVRDFLLGINPKDFDVEVGLASFESLLKVLGPFGATDVVGRSFGVIKLRLPSGEYDFSLPRRESKTGAGHRGFYIQPEPKLGDEEAASRRDFTINSIALDPFTERLIDPFNGRQDLEKRILRHTSEAFAEDPLRVLRAMQFGGRFNLKLAPETAEICRSIDQSYYELPLERIWGEWDKWARQSTHPAQGLRILEQTNWIQFYPEIASMRGTPQEPEWHPEGDVFEHTLHCLDALAGLETWKESSDQRRRMLSFAVLAHDFGKPITTSYTEKRGFMRWISPGHEAAGGPLAEAFMQRIGAPRDLHEPVRTLVVHHLLHHHQNKPGYNESQVRRLARRLMPANIDDLCEVMTADALGRPPINPMPSLNLIQELRSLAQSLSLRTESPKPIILGRHLIACGLKSGPDFKPILQEAFEAQLDGVFHDEDEGLKWLHKRLLTVSLPDRH